METGKTTSILALALIAVIFGFVIHEIFKVRYGVFAVIGVPTACFVMVILMCYGDYLPIKRGRQINFDSGIAGTLRGNLVHHPGGRVSGRLSIERGLVPEEISKSNRVGGIQYLLDWLTVGNITIWVTGEHWQWMDIPSNQTDNKHGAMRFIGNLEGQTLWNEKEMPLYQAMRKLAEINKELVTTLEEVEAQASNMASKQYLDIDIATQLAKTISDRMKNVRIMSRGRGGDVDALGSEMAGG